MRRGLIAPQLERALRTSLQAPNLQLIDLDGERTAHDEEAQPWISVKYGPASHDDWFGVMPAVAHFRRAPGSAAESLQLILKIAPRESLSTTFMPWVFEQLGIALDRPYWEYRQAAEFGDAAGREPHVYRVLAEQVPSVGAVLPKCYGGASDPATGEEALFLEMVTDMHGLDASGATFDWHAADIDEVLRALAGWQAVFWGADERQLAWAGPRPTTADMVADAPLWRAIIDHGRKRMPHIVTEEVWRRRSRLIGTIADWHAVKDTLPATLAHNDFNQRNVGFRTGVLALDWELATRNTAQRDLVELLTFVLPPTADRARVDHHVEVHREALAAAGVSYGIGRETWLAGFRCELKVEALNRVGFQLVFGAQFHLSYAERVNLTVEHLLDLYE
jgi:hydroxymethylglutaryl-CoA reductase (NADPH)